MEASRVGMAPGRVIASFPEGPVNAVMRKAQSVHDLVHEGKDTGWYGGLNLRMKWGDLSLTRDSIEAYVFLHSELQASSVF